MYNNKDQFIQDVMDTFQQTTAFYLTIVCCLFFSIVGLYFSITMFPNVIPYIHIYTTYMTFFILSLLCLLAGIMGLWVLFKYYNSNYQNTENDLCLRYLPQMFTSMIPGFLMLVYVSMVSTTKLFMPIPHICLLLCFYGWFIMFIFYLALNYKINKDKKVYQKQTYRSFQWGLIGSSILAIICLLFFRGTDIEDLIKVGFITAIVTFIAYQAGRTWLAYKFYQDIKIEEMRDRDFYIDGSLGNDIQSLKARVFINNDGYVNKALDVLEEFGFSRTKCMDAILHHKPIYTFDNKMYFDFAYMEKLLMRLSYEGIPFSVQERTKMGWIQSQKYNEIEGRRFIRRKKEVIEEESVKKNSWFTTITVSFLFFIGVVIYGIWNAIFPINYFKPVQ